MSDLDKRFKKAAWLIANGPPQENVSNDQKLTIYALYKQATVGDNTSAQPWAIQLEARAKWDAWEKLKGKSQDDAKNEYINLLASGDANWEQHPALVNYTE